MIAITTQYFIYAFLIAVFAFVYTNVLIQSGEILGKPYKWLYNFFKTSDRERQGLPPHPIFKMIIHCEKCVSGQIALWLFLIGQYKFYNSTWIVAHILFITLSIFFATIIKFIHSKFMQ